MEYGRLLKCSVSVFGMGLKKMTHLVFPKGKTTCRHLTHSHHGQHDETGPMNHPQIPVISNYLSFEWWPFLVLLLA